MFLCYKTESIIYIYRKRLKQVEKKYASPFRKAGVHQCRAIVLFSMFFYQVMIPIGRAAGNEFAQEASHEKLYPNYCHN